MKYAILLLAFSLNLAIAHGQTNLQTAVDSESGEQLYACNASIRHPLPQEAQECLNLSTGEVCFPEKNKPDDGPCVCRTRRSYGDQIFALGQNNRYQTAVAGPDWVSLVGDQQSFSNKILSLDINLGSEDLGAEYMVQYCYVGPQIKLKKKVRKEDPDIDVSQGKYLVDISLAGRNYNRALERVSVDFVCDFRDAGSQDESREKNETAPPRGIVEHDYADGAIIFDNDGSDSVTYSRAAIELNSTSSQVPRFCVFKFKFKEKTGPNLKRDAKFTNGNFSGILRVQKTESRPPSL